MEGLHPLRICMLTHSVYVRDARVRRLAEFLVDEGHTVDVICLASETDESQSHHPNLNIHPSPLTRHRREGALHILDWLVSFTIMFLSLSWLDLRHRYDLVHTHNMPDFIVFCALLPRLRGCPVILNLHDVTPQLAGSKLGVSPQHPVIRILTFIEKISIAFSTHVITETPAAEKTLVQRGAPAEKITVVMNAADHRIFPPRCEDEEIACDESTFTLLYVGTVAHRYGLPVVIRALHLVRPEIPHVKFRIFCKVRDEGAGLDECVQLAKDLGVEDLVEINDPVPLDQMPEIMRRSQIGVYPACQDCHMDVSPSLKIPEMVNMGLPIVATRLAWLVESYGEESIAFVPSEDHEAFAARILELYHSPDVRRTLAKNALRCGSWLNWGSQYSTYRELVDRLTGCGKITT